MSGKRTTSRAVAEELATRACLAVGANAATTRSLVNATISAALFGPPTLGFPHLIDYLNSFSEGRINPEPYPTLNNELSAFLTSNADGGIAQLGFDLAIDNLVDAVQVAGVAVFSQHNSYTTGELGYYARRLAERGLVSICATNANAMLATAPGTRAVYSTNPMAFGFPLGQGRRPLVLDQSSSETAYVNVVVAASQGKNIPKGWAIDKNGVETTDAREALAGALLPFGGRKGANLALMVEMLSAGLSGGAWSLDAANFNSGSDCPAVGLTIIAISPATAGEDLVQRASAHVDRLRGEGIYIPGVSSEKPGNGNGNEIEMSQEVYSTIATIADWG